jgi:hypothetical protein
LRKCIAIEDSHCCSLYSVRTSALLRV